MAHTEDKPVIAPGVSGLAKQLSVFTVPDPHVFEANTEIAPEMKFVGYDTVIETVFWPLSKITPDGLFHLE